MLLAGDGALGAVVMFLDVDPTLNTSMFYEAKTDRLSVCVSSPINRQREYHDIPCASVNATAELVQTTVAELSRRFW